MPAELDEVRTMSNSDCFDVCAFHRDSDVKVVLEGANHPLSEAAEQYLEAQGVLILPDHVVNCGGLIGCWYDWVYRPELTDDEHAKRDEFCEALDQHLKRVVPGVVSANVAKLVDERGADGMRACANSVAGGPRVSNLERVRLSMEADGGQHSRAVARRFHGLITWTGE